MIIACALEKLNSDTLGITNGFYTGLHSIHDGIKLLIWAFSLRCSRGLELAMADVLCT